MSVSARETLDYYLQDWFGDDPRGLKVFMAQLHAELDGMSHPFPPFPKTDQTTTIVRADGSIYPYEWPRPYYWSLPVEKPKETAYGFDLTYNVEVTNVTSSQVLAETSVEGSVGGEVAGKMNVGPIDIKLGYSGKVSRKDTRRKTTSHSRKVGTRFAKSFEISHFTHRCYIVRQYFDRLYVDTKNGSPIFAEATYTAHPKDARDVKFPTFWWLSNARTSQKDSKYALVAIQKWIKSVLRETLRMQLAVY